ncbi:MAG: hypothetical protein IPL76_11100 [Gemmatimonadetes bacterium]|nr:hypothetical protein [Gemmatimonadota bacterium]
MSWPFDDGSDLPLRDGFDVGGAQERKMASMVGGYSGIRTVEELNPDGSITILRTRGGRPIFETTGVARRSAQAQKYRGFVAKIPSRAVLFDPYTLDILDANYQPAVNTYSVQDFATSWNVPTDDDTDWYDVVLFDGSTIKVNAKAMPTLGITANHGYSAIPYVINRETAEDQYGNAERNTTEKRVFAVGRYSVTSWGGGGVTETLTPTAPRTEDRAMTIGQRVDHATNKAWLGQLYHPAAGWDAAGEWYFTSAEITMLLASTYLVKVAGNANVAMSPPSLIEISPSSGSIETAVMLPPTPVGMTGLPYVSQDFTYDGTSGGYIVLRWGFSAEIEKSLAGKLAGSYTRTEYVGSASSTEVQAGRDIEYTATNNKQWDARSERYWIDAQAIVWANHTFSPTYTNLNATSDTLFWGLTDDGYSAADVQLTRGTTGRYISGGGAYPDSYQSRNYETQNGSCIVQIGPAILVGVVFYRQQSSGERVNLYGNHNYYPPYYGPDKYSAFGMGYLNRSEIGYVFNPGSDTIPMIDFYKQNPSPPPNQLPAVVAEVNAMYSGMRDALMTQVVYDSEGSSGYDYRPYGGNSFYFSDKSSKRQSRHQHNVVVVKRLPALRRNERRLYLCRRRVCRRRYGGDSNRYAEGANETPHRHADAW